MKRKLLLSLSCTLLLASCHENTSESLEKESLIPSESIVDVDKYEINVIDVDGMLLGSQEIELNKDTNVFEDLCNNFDVNYTMDTYGPYISSINNSIVDSNYYLAIYENGVAASTGVDGLVADSGDVFEFKVECWNTISSGYGTLDEYDLLVDKVIYGYMKTLDLSKSTSFKDGSYWDLMTIKLAKENYYDSNLFNFDKISNEVKEEINNFDISTLAGADLYKYYLYSVALEKDLTDLKTYAASYVETLADEYSSYVTPFIIAACYGLEIQSEKLTTLTNVEISKDFTWGPDVPVWQYATSSLYNETIDKSILVDCLGDLDYENSCSNALVLQAFAAANENIRDSKYEINGKDLIEVLFDNYYNKDSNILEYTKGQVNTYSTNQVIASLMAYKVCRDTGKKANIYG